MGSSVFSIIMPDSSSSSSSSFSFSTDTAAASAGVDERWGISNVGSINQENDNIGIRRVFEPQPFAGNDTMNGSSSIGNVRGRGRRVSNHTHQDKSIGMIPAAAAAASAVVDVNNDNDSNNDDSHHDYSDLLTPEDRSSHNNINSTNNDTDECQSGEERTTGVKSYLFNSRVKLTELIKSPVQALSNFTNNTLNTINNNTNNNDSYTIDPITVGNPGADASTNLTTATGEKLFFLSTPTHSNHNAGREVSVDVNMTDSMHINIHHYANELFPTEYDFDYSI
jgi:hypothetical protein